MNQKWGNNLLKVCLSIKWPQPLVKNFVPKAVGGRRAKRES